MTGIQIPQKHTLDLTYTDSQKHESTLLQTYVLNEFLTADRSFLKKTLDTKSVAHIFTLLLDLLCPNWSNIRSTVSL